MQLSNTANDEFIEFYMGIEELSLSESAGNTSTTFKKLTDVGFIALKETSCCPCTSRRCYTAAYDCRLCDP